MAPITSADQWVGGGEEELNLPSGNTCLVQIPGLEELFTAGVLPDSLTKIALEQIAKAEKPGAPQDHKKKKPSEAIDPKMMERFLKEEGAIQEIFGSFDRIAEMCVIQPPVKWHMRPVRNADGTFEETPEGKKVYERIPTPDREAGFLYTDRVSLDDKSYIFNVAVGGSRDLEQFRNEFGDAMATLQPGEDVGVPS